MRILIAEDDAVSSKFLSKFLSKYGDVDFTIDGIETAQAFLMAIEDGRPYDLICLDIMMPKVDGVKVLKAFRDIEKKKGIKSDKGSKVIMTTALAETKYVNQAFEIGCEAYVAKPINLKELAEILAKLGILQLAKKDVNK